MLWVIYLKLFSSAITLLKVIPVKIRIIQLRRFLPDFRDYETILVWS